MFGKKTVPENAKEAEAIRKNKISDSIFLFIAVFMTLISAFTYVMVGVGLITTIIIVIWALALLQCVIKGRKRFFELMILFSIAVTIILFFLLTAAKGFHSTTKWKYNAQRKYVDLMHNGHSDCFPDKLPDDISDYSIEYLPSFLQGTGHFRVHFKTSTEQIARYENEYSAQAIYTIPLSDFNDSRRVQVKEISPKASATYEGDSTLDVSYDNKFWEGHENNSTVYFISAVHNWNHPHSGAVIINKTEKMVEFTHLG